MPTPAIHRDYLLYLKQRGGDALIEDDKRFNLMHGMSFYSAPRIIGAG